MKKGKFFDMIEESQAMKAEMNTLKTSTKVARYLKLEDERKSVHDAMRIHIKQYGVDTEPFRKVGLVVSKSSWVVVKEVEALIREYPDYGDFLLPLIHTKPSYYTRSIK